MEGTLFRLSNAAISSAYQDATRSESTRATKREENEVLYSTLKSLDCNSRGDEDEGDRTYHDGFLLIISIWFSREQKIFKDWS